MKKLQYPKDQKLTGVRVTQVWLKDDLIKSEYDNRVHRGLWKIFNQEDSSVGTENLNYIKTLKDFIVSAEDLFMIILDTKIETERGVNIGGYTFLTDRNDFIDITMLMRFTSFAGCRFKVIEPPFEDFINEFIGEVYF